MNSIKAIETQYKGYRFRSRTEARWAVAFDAMGLKWEYEKEGFDLGENGLYLPDFWLPERQMFIEIKGSKPNQREFSVAAALHNATSKAVLIIGGIPDQGGQIECYESFPYYADVSQEPIQRNHDWMQKFSGEFDDAPKSWGNRVQCPFCGDDYIHFGSAENIKGEDNYKAWDGRGDAIRIRMSCEHGHSWVLRFGFHKGFTFADIEDCRRSVTDVGKLLSGGNLPKLNYALDIARSARFEHGETPTFIPFEESLNNIVWEIIQENRKQ